MRIALSLLAFRPGRVGGAETVVRNLLRHLPDRAGGDELVAILDRDLAAGLSTPGFARVVVPVSARRVVAERILEAFTPYRARAVARAIEGAGTDVVLFPQQSIFPIDLEAPALLTVHDLQHLVLPENFGWFDTAFRARAYPRSLERAARILAISEVTRQDLVTRCAVDPRRVDVVPNGFTPRAPAGEAAPWSPGAPYLFYPAATYAHKGHDVLLRSFAALRERTGPKRKLVFTGERTARWKSLERLAGELRIAGDVLHLGFLPAAEVTRVYAGAEAVVFPTRFEGFGQPVLEAVTMRKKVIVSRLPIFDELGVPRHWQIDFSDPEQLAAALAAEGPTELERSPWSWEQVAQRTLDIARRVGRGEQPALAAE
jgi:glycosyltransferase involved in cell wall biosynthesis